MIAYCTKTHSLSRSFFVAVVASFFFFRVSQYKGKSTVSTVQHQSLLIENSFGLIKNYVFDGMMGFLNAIWEGIQTEKKSEKKTRKAKARETEERAKEKGEISL